MQWLVTDCHGNTINKISSIPIDKSPWQWPPYIIINVYTSSRLHSNDWQSIKLFIYLNILTYLPLVCLWANTGLVNYNYLLICDVSLSIITIQLLKLYIDLNRHRLSFFWNYDLSLHFSHLMDRNIVRECWESCTASAKSVHVL